ncbi:MAG: DnaD domain protein [Chloroflexi bacterium]|nr:DnaD domain protein [Chloroflexota bacterium]
MNNPFQGFQPQTASTFPLYESIILELLPQIDDLAELKVTLFALWAIRQREGSARYMLIRDIAAHPALFASLGEPPAEAAQAALRRAHARGTLLCESVRLQGGEEMITFINDDAGRVAAEQLRSGNWLQVTGEHPVEILPPRPSIYRLYEQNIGALTPMIRDELLAAQQDFPAVWIEEAMRLAVANNKRNWRYVRAILDRWQKEGKENEASARSTAEGDERIWRSLSDFLIK